jgi:ABC-type glycerol-3-phosphate transport system permease component
MVLQILALFVAPAGGCIIWFRSRTPGASKRTALSRICLAYFLTLLFFAQLYFYMYSVRQDNFSVSQDVSASRRRDIIAAQEDQIVREEKLNVAVGQLLNAVRDRRIPVKVSPADSNFVQLRTIEYVFEFMFDPSWSGVKDGRRVRAAVMSVRDDRQNLIGQEVVSLGGPSGELQRKTSAAEWNRIVAEYFPPTSPEQYSEMATPVQDAVQRRLRGLRSEAAQPLDKPRPREWRFIDFIYFSTITQTTVGYGDILPNSSIVRCAVIVQVLLGLLLVGFAISWVTSKDGD